MEKSFSPENLDDVENKEREPRGREIDFYLFRHAEATGGGIDAEVTEQGKEQAVEAAENLLQRIIQEGGGVIKFLSSPVRRAGQTAEIMQSTLKKLLAEQGIENIRLMNPHDREALRAAGVIGPLKQRGIDNPIEYWFRNPESLEGKSPQKTAEQLRKIIDSLQRMADRLPSGEKIYYIGVTHEVPQAALLHQVTGKTLDELGGGIKNCESIKVELRGKSDEIPTVSFRDSQMKVEQSSTDEH